MSQSPDMVAALHEAWKLLSPAERDALEALFFEPQKPFWCPFPGPQTMAMESKADELFYGGSAGGGKSDCLLGMALTKHRHSLIFRREYPQLRSMVQRSYQIIGDKGSYNSQTYLWRLKDGRTMEFGACQNPQDVQRYMGRPHDLIGYDEAPNFQRDQITFLSAWNRPADGNPKQRCRVVLTGNPPTTPEARWVVEEYAPWLDRTHPDFAEPGQLRWYAREADGSLLWLTRPEPVRLKGGEVVFPKSRTFIPARVDHNPVLLEAGYKTTLMGLPEPLRSQMLYGDFSVGMTDDPFQVIPTAWVQAAQMRWYPDCTDPITCVGTDPARGGKDKTVIACLHGNWVAPLTKVPGKATPDGPTVAALVRSHMTDPRVPVNIDVIGVGASVIDHLRQGHGCFRGIDGRHRCERRDRSGQLHFVNNRSFIWWALRDRLNPMYGENLCLPPDPELLADLTAPRWKQTPRGIQVETKEEIYKRIARSPDCADAACLACYPFGEFAFPSAANQPPERRRGLYDTERPSSIRRRGFLGLTHQSSSSRSPSDEGRSRAAP